MRRLPAAEVRPPGFHLPHQRPVSRPVRATAARSAEGPSARSSRSTSGSSRADPAWRRRDRARRRFLQRSPIAQRAAPGIDARLVLVNDALSARFRASRRPQPRLRRHPIVSKRRHCASAACVTIARLEEIRSRRCCVLGEVAETSGSTNRRSRSCGAGSTAARVDPRRATSRCTDRAGDLHQPLGSRSRSAQIVCAERGTRPLGLPALTERTVQLIHRGFHGRRGLRYTVAGSLENRARLQKRKRPIRFSHATGAASRRDPL